MPSKLFYPFLHHPFALSPSLPDISSSLPALTGNLIGESCQMCQILFHLPGNRPFSRQVGMRDDPPDRVGDGSAGWTFAQQRARADWAFPFCPGSLAPRRRRIAYTPAPVPPSAAIGVQKRPLVHTESASRVSHVQKRPLVHTAHFS